MALEEGGSETPTPKRAWWNPLRALRALQRMGEEPDPDQPVRILLLCVYCCVFGRLPSGGVHSTASGAHSPGRGGWGLFLV